MSSFDLCVNTSDNVPRGQRADTEPAVRLPFFVPCDTSKVKTCTKR